MTESQKATRDLPPDAVFGYGGGHGAKSKTKCLMEWSAFRAGEEHTAEPLCVSRVITIACQKFSDGIGKGEKADARRAELGFAALSEEVLGTNTSAEDDDRRSYLALDWLFRVYTTAWLDLAGLGDDAAAFRGAPEVVDLVTCAALEQIATKARDNARAVESEVRSAVGVAPWSAAWSASWSAMMREAAWTAAWSASWSALWAAKWTADECKARSVAWSAAWVAAESAAETAAWVTAESAAESAIAPTVGVLQVSFVGAIAPTVGALQVSFVALIRRMCAVGREG